MRTRTKICGITRVEDALVAVRAGADAVGFVFVASSARAMAPAAARAIVRELPPFVTVVGVFVNATPAQVGEVASTVGLHALQLHGDEKPMEYTGIGLPVIKAFRTGPQFNAAEARWHGAQAVLVDGFDERLFGGTGILADWDAALSLRNAAPLILSGGLTPVNVAEAIRAVSPFGVDVSSGVESSPGRKDHGLIRAFLEAVRRQDRIDQDSLGR